MANICANRYAAFARTRNGAFCFGPRGKIQAEKRFELGQAKILRSHANAVTDNAGADDNASAIFDGPDYLTKRASFGNGVVNE